MKYLFIMLFLFSFRAASAQKENKFQDYLNHCKEMKTPFDICIDSAKVFFYHPEAGIPLEYVRMFICQPNKTGSNTSQKYEYYYGIRINLGKYIAVITCKECDECGSKYGLGIGFYVMTIHTADGTIISQKVIAQGSDQHFYFGNFTKGDSHQSLLTLSIKRGTMLEYLDKINSIFQGVLDYYIYTVDASGIINEEYKDRKNIKISWPVEGVEILQEW